MKKTLFEYEKKKEVRLYGVAGATPFEKGVMNVTITFAFFGFIITFFLACDYIVPLYVPFIIIAVPVVFLIIFAIRHFVFMKEPMHYESYNKEIKKNAFTGEDTIDISNYKEKTINEDKKSE